MFNIRGYMYESGTSMEYPVTGRTSDINLISSVNYDYLPQYDHGHDLGIIEILKQQHKS